MAPSANAGTVVLTSDYIKKFLQPNRAELFVAHRVQKPRRARNTIVGRLRTADPFALVVWLARCFHPIRTPLFVGPLARDTIATVADKEPLPDWERLLAAERHLQHIVPGTVLVGGTAAALHAGHRASMDGDRRPARSIR